MWMLVWAANSGGCLTPTNPQCIHNTKVLRDEPGQPDQPWSHHQCHSCIDRGTPACRPNEVMESSYYHYCNMFSTHIQSAEPCRTQSRSFSCAVCTLRSQLLHMAVLQDHIQITVRRKSGMCALNELHNCPTMCGQPMLPLGCWARRPYKSGYVP